MLGHDPHHHANYFGRQLQVLLAGSRSLVFLGEPDGEGPAGVLGHRRPAAYLGVQLRVGLIVNGEAGPWVAAQVTLLASSLGGGDQQVIFIPADPDDRSLRAAVRVDRGEDSGIGIVQELANLFIQHGCHDLRL